MVPSGADAATNSSPARGGHGVPPQPASGPPARAPPHAPPSAALRRRRGRHPDGLDQRARARALSHGLEPLRSLRSRAARPPRVSPSAAARVLGARRLPRADLDAAVVEARHARLSGPPHRLVGLAADEPQAAGERRRRHPRQRPPEPPRPRGTPAAAWRWGLVELAAGPARPALPVDDR